MFPTFVGKPVIDCSLEGMKKGNYVTPTEEFRLSVIEDAKTISFDDPKETEKMRRCEHKRMVITGGFPSNILGCCDCGWWQFF